MILDDEERPLLAAHVCWDEGEANIVIGVLRENGIQARINSEVPREVLPLSADGLGKIEVLVKGERVEESRRIISQYQSTPILDDEQPTPDASSD